jgi:hypothetical protein
MSGVGLLGDANVMSRLRGRLRAPAWPQTVPGSLPVLFFGDLPNSTIATLGINPSWQEYLHRPPKGGIPERELDGPSERRFETLSSLGASSRADLTDDQGDRAIDMMRGYFGIGRPAYGWFDHLKRILEGLHVSYEEGAVAHLDLVQESTWPAWSGMDGVPKERVLHSGLDFDFLKWELETLPLTLVLANGRTPWDWLCKAAQVENPVVVRATKWLEWMVGQGKLGGRKVWAAGWTQALHQPTGLGNKGESALGASLAAELRSQGFRMVAR